MRSEPRSRVSVAIRRSLGFCIAGDVGVAEVSFRFGPFTLDRGTGELFKSGARIRLQTKPLQILAMLLAKSGEVVTREELSRTLWSQETFVDFESGLNTATNRLRAALGDCAESPRYIETLPRVGYRFVCPVTRIESVPPAAATEPPAKTYQPWMAMASVLAIISGLAYFHVKASAPVVRPSFRQLTFRAGAIGAARFVPGSDNAVYTAINGIEPPRTSMVRLDGDGLRNLDFADGILASISPRGELALMSRAASQNPTIQLSSVPQSGGPARRIAEAVRGADWLPDGAGFALVRRRGAEAVLEFPAGHVVHSSAGWIDSVRVSPSGDRLAFFEHPVRDDDGGYLCMADRQGHVTTLTRKWSSAGGLAWAASNKEIWFTAGEAGFARALYAVSRTGRLRRVSNSPYSLYLFDISRTGRALVGVDDIRTTMMAQLASESDSRDVSNQDSSHVDDISRDGQLILFTEASSAAGKRYAAYTFDRKSHRAVRFAAGRGLALSPDGKSALTIDPEDRHALTLTSLLTGTSRRIEGGGFEYQWARFLPDGKSLLVGGSYPLEALSVCTQFIEGGTPIALADAPYMDNVVASPDGAKFAGVMGGQLELFDTSGHRHMPLLAGERAAPVAWSADGNFLYVALVDGPRQILKLNLRSGGREIWKALSPNRSAAYARLSSVVAAPEAGAYAYSVELHLSRLYVVDGWS